MRYNKLIAVLLIFAFSLYSCSPITKLIKTDSEYRPVIPERSRLIINYQLNETKITPEFPITIYQELFSNKALTLNYETKHPSKKGLEVFGGLALGAAAAGLFISSGKTAPKDTTSRVLLVIGGIGASIGSLYLLFKGTPTDYWSRDSIINHDTIYSFKTPLQSTLLTIKSKHDNKSNYFTSSENGIVSIDLRKFYEKLPENSDLLISISHYDAIPADLKISNSYIRKVKQYELEADNLLEEANDKIKNKKYIEAEILFKRIVLSYDQSNASKSAKNELIEIVDKVKEEKITEGRKILRSVSVNKVPAAIDGARITESELQTLGWRLENISKSEAAKIIIDGFEMSLDHNSAYSEYLALNNSQKIFALLAAAEKISKNNRTDKSTVLIQLIRIDGNLAKKLSTIESVKLLER